MLTFIISQITDRYLMSNFKKIAILALAVSGYSSFVYAQSSNEGCNLFRFNTGSEKTASKIQYPGCNPQDSVVIPSTPDEPEESSEEFEQDAVYEFLDGVDPDYWYSSGYTCATEISVEVAKYTNSSCGGYLSDVKLLYPDNTQYNTWGLEYDDNDKISATFYKAIQGDNASEMRIGNLALRTHSNSYYALGVWLSSTEFQPVGYIEKNDMKPFSTDPTAPLLEVKKENLHKFRIVYDNGLVSAYFNDSLIGERALTDSFSRDNRAVYQYISQGPASWWGPLAIHLQRRAPE